MSWLFVYEPVVTNWIIFDSIMRARGDWIILYTIDSYRKWFGYPPKNGNDVAFAIYFTLFCIVACIFLPFCLDWIFTVRWFVRENILPAFLQLFCEWLAFGKIYFKIKRFNGRVPFLIIITVSVKLEILFFKIIKIFKVLKFVSYENTG